MDTKSVHTIQSIQLQEIRDHNKHIVQPPKFTAQAIKNYFGSRFRSLFVPKEELEQYTWADIYNPFSALREVSLREWNFFFLGFWAWTWDAFDFFTVSLNITNIAEASFGSVSQRYLLGYYIGVDVENCRCYYIWFDW